MQEVIQELGAVGVDLVGDAHLEAAGRDGERAGHGDLEGARRVLLQEGAFISGEAAHLLDPGARNPGKALLVLFSAVHVVPVHHSVALGEALDGVREAGHPCQPAQLPVGEYAKADFMLYLQEFDDGLVLY